MRKSIIPILICISFLTSCGNLAIPKSLKVKTNASYNFTVAKLNMALSDYVSADQLIPTSDDSTFEVYDYNPKSNTEKIQEYIVRMPIQEIPIDFSAYLSSTDFGDSISGMDIADTTVEIPEVPIEYSKEYEGSDIAALLSVLLSDLVKVSGNVYETVEVTGEGGSFSEIHYKSGTYAIEISNKSDYNDTAVSLYSNGNKIGIGTLVNGKASIDLAGKTLYGSATEIHFDSTIPETVTFKGSCTNGNVNKILGLTNTNALSSVSLNESVDTDSMSTVDSVTFGEDCKFKIDYNMPSDWTGVNFVQKLTLSGAMNLESTEKDISIEGKTLTPGSDIKINMEITPSFTNANLNTSGSMSVNITSEVSKLQKVVVKADGIDTDLTVNQDLPEEAKNMLKEIVWNAGTGFKVTYTNTFPAGNDFVLKNIKSTFLGIANTTQTLSAGTENGTVTFASTLETTDTINSSTKIDLSGTLDLPGDEDGKVVMTGVVAGESYKLALKAEPVLDWKTVTLNSDKSTVTGDVTIDINKATLFKTLDETLGTTFADTMNINSLPVNIFCEAPDIDQALTDPKFEGVIKAYLGTKVGDTVTPVAGKDTVYLLGSKNGLVDKTAEMVTSSEPALKFTDENVETTAITGGTSGNLASLFNQSEDGEVISVAFTMTFSTGNSGEIVLEKDKVTAAGATSIEIVAYVTLPLDTSLSGTESINVMKLVGMDSTKDLFGRTEAPSNEKIEKFLQIVKSAAVSFKPEEVPFVYDNPVYVHVDIDGDGTDYEASDINLSGGKFEVADPAGLINIYPLKPSCQIVIPSGRFAIKRDAAIKTPVKLTVNTDGSWDFN